MSDRSITIYCRRLCHFVETVVIQLSWLPDCRVVLATTTADSEPAESEHPWSVRRLESCPGVQVVSVDAPPTESDWFLIGIAATSRVRDPRLVEWSRRGRNVGLLWQDLRTPGVRGVLRDLLRTFPYWLQARTALFQERRPRWHKRFPHLRYQDNFTPYVHAQFMIVPELRRAMFESAVPEIDNRLYRLGFIGSRTPEERGRLLDGLREELQSAHGIDVTGEYAPSTAFRAPSPDSVSQSSASPGSALWIDYSRDSKSRGLAPGEYAQALSEMQFCLCPDGWGGNWTHRVIESLIRGAIPILEDEDRYRLPLRDGETCISVRAGDWKGAIARALETPSPQLGKMHSQILQLVQEYLSPAAVSSRLCAQLGLG